VKSSPQQRKGTKICGCGGRISLALLLVDAGELRRRRLARIRGGGPNPNRVAARAWKLLGGTARATGSGRGGTTEEAWEVHVRGWRPMAERRRRTDGYDGGGLCLGFERTAAPNRYDGWDQRVRVASDESTLKKRERRSNRRISPAPG
jgi:hypothetical protein